MIPSCFTSSCETDARYGSRPERAAVISPHRLGGNQLGNAPLVVEPDGGICSRIIRVLIGLRNQKAVEEEQGECTQGRGRQSSPRIADW